MSGGAPPSPEAYAREKIDDALDLWNGELGRYVREYGDVLAPGIAPEAWIGFATNNPPGDEGASRTIWEYGPFGVSGGERTIPGPHSDRTRENNWYDLHDDDRVRAPLGRDASMAPGGWRDPRDQTAVGIVSLLEHGYSVATALPEAVRPSGTLRAAGVRADVGGLWFTFLAFMGWSAGNGGAASVVRRYAEQLARAPEDGRVGMLLALYARDGASGRVDYSRGETYSNPLFALLRTWQKLAAARLLAERVGGDVSFFSLGGDGDWAWISAAVTSMAAGAAPPSRVSTGVFYAYGPGSGVVAALSLTAIGAAIAVAIALAVGRGGAPVEKRAQVRASARTRSPRALTA